MSRHLAPLNLGIVTAVAVLAAGALGLAQTAALGDELDFYRDIYPFLRTNCISCHNKTTTKAHLNMESPELLRKGGESGPAVVPGKSGDSLILQAAAHTGETEMPPKRNKTGAVDLAPSELALLRTWIDQGAKSSIQEERHVVWQPLPPGVHPIYTVATTNDGRYAACGRANQIFLYDLATRQPAGNAADPSGTAHRANVQALAFSPDGRRLASGSFREVKIWRREKAAPVARKSDQALGLAAATLNVDGQQIIAADPHGALHLLEAVTGKMLKTIPSVDAAGVKLLSFSPDSSRVAVYGADATLSVWSLADGKAIASQSGVAGVRALVWTRDGKQIAAAGDDKVIRVWPLPAAGSADLGAPLELKGAAGPVAALESLTAPDRLLAASDDGKVRLWNLSDQKMARELALGGVVALASSGDGKQFAAGCADGAVRVWDLESAKQTAELRGDMASSEAIAKLDWTSAAQAVETVFQTKEAARIETENKALDELLKKANESLDTAKKALPEKQKAAATTADAKTAAQKSADALKAALAEAPGGKPDAAWEKQNKAAQAALTAAAMAAGEAQTALSAAENHIKDGEAELVHIAAAKDKNAAALSAANAAGVAAKATAAKAAVDLAAAKQALASGAHRAIAVAYSRDAQTIAALCNDGVQRVWAVASGTPIDQVSVAAAAKAGSVSASAAGGFIACAADGSIAGVGGSAHWVVERVLGGQGNDSPFVDRVNAVRFSPDGKTLAVGGGEPSRSGDISLWDVASGKAIKTWNERHSDSVLCLDFSPDGKLLASGGADKLARVTDIASGKEVDLFEGHTHHVMGVSFRADGRVLATAGGDGVVLIWDMIMGERKKKIEGWEKEVTSLQYLGATAQIVTSAGDNLVRIVNDEGTEVRAIAKLPEFMQSAASADGGRVIVAGGEDSVLRVWDGTNGKEIVTFATKPTNAVSSNP